MRIGMLGLSGAVALLLHVAFGGWSLWLALSVVLLPVSVYGVYRAERVKQAIVARIDDGAPQSPAGSLAMLRWMVVGGAPYFAVWLITVWRSGALAAL